MEDIKFSVIIPLYNKESTIGRSISSVINQSYSNYELIIIDDGSMDKSANLVREFLDAHIRYFYQNNQGVSVARNRGVQESLSEWIIFLDADDYLYKDCLKHFANVISINMDLDLVCANFNINIKGNVHPFTNFSYDGIVRNTDKYKWLLLHRYWPGRAGSYAIKKHLVELYPFDSNFVRNEDVAIGLKWLSVAKVYRLNQLVMSYAQDNLEASKPVSKYKKDFVFHLDFYNASFWEKLFFAQLYHGAKNNYPTKKNYLKKKYGKYEPYILLSRFIYITNKIIDIICHIYK